jgi:hypothetical protein
MKESQIQAHLEKLIQEERLLSCINNLDAIENLYKSLNSEDCLPSFSLDYFSRKKLISAARNVISSLGSAQIITTASKNISINRKEKLYPDLVLFNEYDRKIIVLEIKRSVKTARETLTEMLAYDYEIRNLLPFLSNFEIVFCIVSTEYSTLLNHSVSGLSTWESKQILCLHIQELDEEEMKMEVYIPPAWTSLGMSEFPSTAISVVNIVLYKRSDDESSADAESAIFYAASLIAKEGDRNNSHGFVLIWLDTWGFFEGAADYYIILGFINPYVFLPFAQDIGVIDASQSPIGQYFLENSDSYRSHHCEEVFAKGTTFLEKYFDVRTEGFSNWNNDRAKSHEVYNPTCLLRHRAIPLRVELWGALGDFSRELIVHPGFEKHVLSKLSGAVLGCEDPFIAIPLIDSISGVRRLDSRGFTCKALFDLGVSLGSLLTMYNTAAHSEKDDLRNLPASITWATLDVFEVLLDLSMQYSLSSQLNVPPPVVKLRPSGNFEEALKAIQSLIDWIRVEFVTSARRIHIECFDSGLYSYPLMDDYFLCALPDHHRVSIEEKLISSSRFILQWISRECVSDYTPVELARNVAEIFSNEYLVNADLNARKDSLTSLVDEISNEQHLALYHDTLMNLLDNFILPINYKIPPSHDLSEYTNLDWVWIREEILRSRERGIGFPALKADLMGRVGILDISREIYASSLKHIDFESQFVFITSSNAMDMALIRNWEEVIY